MVKWREEMRESGKMEKGRKVRSEKGEGENEKVEKGGRR